MGKDTQKATALLATKRQDRDSVLTEVFRGKVELDAVVNLIDSAVAGSEELAKLDSVVAKHDGAVLDSVGGSASGGLSGIITSAIMQFANEGREVSIDSVATALAAAEKAVAGSDVNLDAAGDVAGADILASYVALNIYMVLSSSIDGIDGSISDMTPLAGDTTNTKYQVMSVSPVASKGMGDVADGTVISPINSTQNMALTVRTGSVVSATATLTYSFVAKAKSTDASGYKLAVGKNEVAVGSDLIFDDFDAMSNEPVTTRVTTVDGVTYTVTFTYATGVIDVVLSSAIADGTKIVFTAGLDTKKLSEITGEIEVDLIPQRYVSRTVAISTTAQELSSRRVLQSGKMNLLAIGAGAAMNKIAQELTALKVKLATDMATSYGGIIDLTSGTRSDIASQYKEIDTAIDSAVVDISTKAEVSSNAVLVGGSALVKIFSGLTDPTQGSAVPAIDENTGFRFLGTMKGGRKAYYNPNHDAQFPVTNGESKVFVIGSPADPTKRAVISGVGLPVLPVDLLLNQDSHRTISLQGELVVSANKDKRSRQLARVLTVKV